MTGFRATSNQGPTMQRQHRARTLTVLGTAALLCQPFGTLAAQASARPAEVRQIVTFLFQPGRSAEAVTIYEQQLKPIYREISALRRFRAYREAESPEPLDLVVVSSYDGMAGMDAGNEESRRPRESGPSVFALYGTLSGMTQSHHDQFVEMLPALSDTASDEGGLTVFEYIRVIPGGKDRFIAILSKAIRPYEQSRKLYQWSESGRMLVSDGWDFVRIHGIRSLADWQRYRAQLTAAPSGPLLDSMIAARKTLILRRDGRLSVR
jgi:hypothetical protein